MDGVPYTMTLPEGRTLFVRVPRRMTGRDRDGSLTFTPEGVKLLDRIRVLAMDTPAAPTPGYIRALRDTLDLSRAELARRIGYTTASVEKWEGGALRPGRQAVKQLHGLVESETRRGVVVGRG